MILSVLIFSEFLQKQKISIIKRTDNNETGNENKTIMMNQSENFEETFLRFCKFFDKLRLSGAQAMGQKNFKLLVALTYRQQKSLFIVGDGEKKTEEGIHQKDLARELKTTVPATSLLVDVMVKKNLIQRLPSSKDRRSFCLRLTPFGKKTLEIIQKNIRKTSEDLLDGLSDEDKSAFIRIVDHFSQKLTINN